ncbi:MAG: hypothetical protein RMK18_07860 [Armatimonadota bacterium]|nr:hypothetical protein [Armatimonadota bacterium]MCX7778415.1 hypothetical protein [Armatimonadota bacterium]MDW8025759.1 hypothetical protein [Armatimonadota bacterium]
MAVHILRHPSPIEQLIEIYDEVGYEVAVFKNEQQRDNAYPKRSNGTLQLFRKTDAHSLSPQAPDRIGVQFPQHIVSRALAS